jgi:hypothetical protein
MTTLLYGDESVLRNRNSFLVQNNFPMVYGPRKFIIMFARFRHWTQIWARCIQSLLPYPIPSISILLYHLDHLFGLVVIVPGYRSRGPGFDSLRYQIFWEVVGLKRGRLSLVSTTEVILGRKSSGSGLESQEYGRRDPSSWTCDTLYPQKLALSSPKSDCGLVGIVHSRTKATEFLLLLLLLLLLIYPPTSV